MSAQHHFGRRDVWVVVHCYSDNVGKHTKIRGSLAEHYELLHCLSGHMCTEWHFPDVYTAKHSDVKCEVCMCELPYMPI